MRNRACVAITGVTRCFGATVAFWKISNIYRVLYGKMKMKMKMKGEFLSDLMQVLLRQLCAQPGHFGGSSAFRKADATLSAAFRLLDLTRLS